MEIKYGRSYKLSNGDKEYIEVSMNVMGNVDIEHGFNSMKWQVEEIHNKTERSLVEEKEREISFEKYINQRHNDKND